ncbi:MAG: helix-turn-helix transcriptional regulator [Verrucomicrobiota bacterium]
MKGNSSYPTSTRPLQTLTKRQLEILKWIAEGKSNSEIAIILEISPRTVEKHCENIFEKLGVDSRLAASRVFDNQKLL